MGQIAQDSFSGHQVVEVLLGAYVCGAARTEQLAAVTELGLPEVGLACAELERQQAAITMDDLLILTASGRALAAGEAARRYSDIRGTDATESAMAEFERLNERFRREVSRWQVLREAALSVSDDHGRGTYDSGPTEQLSELVEALRALTASGPLAEAKAFAERLAQAVLRARDDARYVADPQLDSIHTIWFQMHEWLLLILGRERSE